jgi:prepilin-type N-terminal cleavage/methylation domain-containing protein
MMGISMESDHNGFTLIEIIVTLILVGIISVFATFWVLDITRGYIQGIANMSTSLKGNVVLSRIYRELSNLHNISNADNDSILFSRENSTIGIALVGNTLRMQKDTLPSSIDTPILVDNVDSFSLSYFKTDGTNWNTGLDINQLAKIHIELVLNSQSTPVEFVTSINPIYNNTYNGPYAD